MEEETLLSLSDYLEILYRCKWSLIIPSVGISLIAVILALILPNTYKSTATILVEERQISSEYIKTTVTSYTEQRIQQIKQRIMSTGRLLEIMNQFDLYKKLRADRTTNDIVTRMRSNINLDPITDQAPGRNTEATIAFSLSFQGRESPQKVQLVAEKLTNLFLEENRYERTKQTKEVSRFLEDELNKVKSSLDSQEAEIARFKEKHINTLPELLQVNIQSLNHMERNIEMSQEKLRSLKEQEGYFQSQLVNVSPDLKEQQEDKKRLDELKVLLINLKSRFTEEYPDVINTRAEIARLEMQLAKKESLHPTTKESAENPAYITLAAQLSGIQADIKSTHQQIVIMMQKAQKYRKQIENTPRVEETYRTLTIKRDNTRAKYDDLMQKVLEAKVSQGLETEQKGERFTVIDPPLFPEKPFKPNRLLIVMIGMVLGLCAGVSFAAMREFSDDSVHSAERLATVTTFPVLTTIPLITTRREAAPKHQ
jgi:polysaccharide chain length determinant protein (PEP-CTERM system associated)